MNEKLTNKIKEIEGVTYCEYDKNSRIWTINIKNQFTDNKKLDKLDLIISAVSESFEKDGLVINLKRKPQGQKWLIGTLSFMIMMIAVQLLYIADNAVFYLKP